MAWANIQLALCFLAISYKICWVEGSCKECLTIHSYDKSIRDTIAGALENGDRHTAACESDVASVTTTCTRGTDKCATVRVAATWSVSGIEVGEATIMARGCTATLDQACPVVTLAGAADVITGLAAAGTPLTADTPTEEGCTCDTDDCNTVAAALPRLSCHKCFFVAGPSVTGSVDSCKASGTPTACGLNEQCAQALITDGTVTPAGGEETKSGVVVRECFLDTELRASTCTMASNPTAAQSLAAAALGAAATAVTATAGETCVCSGADCNNNALNIRPCHECLAVKTSHAGLGRDLHSLDTYDGNCDSATGIGTDKMCYGLHCVAVEVEASMTKTGTGGPTNEMVTAVGRTCVATSVDTDCDTDYTGAQGIINDLLGASSGITIGDPTAGNAKGCDCATGDNCANTAFAFPDACYQCVDVKTESNDLQAAVDALTGLKDTNCDTTPASVRATCDLGTDKCIQVKVSGKFTTGDPAKTGLEGDFVARGCGAEADYTDTTCATDLPAFAKGKDFLDNLLGTTITVEENGLDSKGCTCKMDKCNNEALPLTPQIACHQCVKADTDNTELKNAIESLTNMYDENCDSGSSIATARTCTGSYCVQTEVTAPVTKDGSSAVDDVKVFGRGCTDESVNTDCATDYTDAKDFVDGLLGDDITVGAPVTDGVKGCDCATANCNTHDFVPGSGGSSGENGCGRIEILTSLVFGLGIMNLLYNMF